MTRTEVSLQFQSICEDNNLLPLSSSGLTEVEGNRTCPVSVLDIEIVKGTVKTTHFIPGETPGR